MDLVELKAEQRDAGKATTKRVRADGRIPAIFYGHGIDPLSLSIDAKTFRSVIHSEAGTNVILKLMIDGKKGNHTAIIKDIQRHPVKDYFFHIDFLKIAMDEKIQAKVPVNVVGESIGVREGGVLQHGLWEIEVEALPANLPENIEIDVSELAIGGAVRIADLVVGDDVAILTDPEETVVSVVPPTELKEEEVVEEEMLEPELVGAEAAEGGAGAEAPAKAPEAPAEETGEKEE
jgi:large subunit ribosomal protein L25